MLAHGKTLGCVADSTDGCTQRQGHEGVLGPSQPLPDVEISLPHTVLTKRAGKSGAKIASGQAWGAAAGGQQEEEHGQA